MLPRLELALIKFLGQSDLPNYAHLSSIYPQKSDQNGQIHWEMLHQWNSMEKYPPFAPFRLLT